MCGIVNDHGNVTSGKASPQPLYDGERRISYVLNAEDDLKCWVSLAATRRERFLQQRFVAAERLQDGHWWKPCRKGRWPRGEADRRNPADETLD
jgi:hypothetical protein